MHSPRSPAIENANCSVTRSWPHCLCVEQRGERFHRWAEFLYKPLYVPLVSRQQTNNNQPGQRTTTSHTRINKRERITTTKVTAEQLEEEQRRRRKRISIGRESNRHLPHIPLKSFNAGVRKPKHLLLLPVEKLEKLLQTAQVTSNQLEATHLPP
ncbi:uncharacterized protein LOC108143902 isoform X1 [Drosophila elegans]|uniref:uncharacterized protein LOC108143902 isoform X1 n=1 Tax=Drosophila elegans TaxID=30023 RepID=UPI0007E768BD|nr:uncharacterized protein LOC108143902 isoform X1 [Drosophila elegans]